MCFGLAGQPQAGGTGSPASAVCGSLHGDERRGSLGFQGPALPLAVRCSGTLKMTIQEAARCYMLGAQPTEGQTGVASGHKIVWWWVCTCRSEEQERQFHRTSAMQGLPTPFPFEHASQFQQPSFSATHAAACTCAGAACAAAAPRDAARCLAASKSRRGLQQPPLLPIAGRSASSPACIAERQVQEGGDSGGGGAARASRRQLPRVPQAAAANLLSAFSLLLGSICSSACCTGRRFAPMPTSPPRASAAPHKPRFIWEVILR